jgi:catechol 2,3-dioxygenase-like lactoylglutathione lyase family enzyme
MPTAKENMMINGVSIVTVWVLDTESAKEFYTKRLGFDLTTDIQLDSGMRWLTVRSPGSAGQEFLLVDPAHSMLDADTAVQVRALVAKGALNPGVMATTDCRADYETLVERGVEFIQPPADRPYGIEAVLRDDSGNWFSFTQRRAAEST